MYNDLIAYKGENEEEYLWKLGQAKDNGIVDIDWNTIAEMMNKQFRDDESEYKTEAAYRKPYQQAKRFFENGVFANKNKDTYVSEIREARDELYKEKCKVQTEKLEYNKWRREEARDELILEKLLNAIKNANELPLPNFRAINENPLQATDWLLAFGDCHYGIEFEILDLYGSVINRYNPEEFVKRLEFLFDKLVSIILKEGIKKISIWEMGDAIQGILRLNSQLMKLRYGIIDSSILYANIIAKWLNDLSEYVYIDFQMVLDSNHNQLRICSAPKNAFPEENVSKIILAIIEAKLGRNPRINIIKNITGMNFGTFAGYNVLGVHGELKNINKSIGDFSVTYNTPINYIVGAHIHHNKQEEVGIDYEAISIPSMVGTDPYGLTLAKTARAGAKLMGFVQGQGKEIEYNIKVN